ncbi:MAG: hypothetical protein U0441_04835 [Polyangiaceae bacterium]
MRDLAPPELRYQYLESGTGMVPWIVGGVTGVATGGGTLALAVASGQVWLFVAAPILGLTLAAFGGSLTGPFVRDLKTLYALPTAIVPWGLLIDPDKRPAAVPWRAIRKISHTFIAKNRRDEDNTQRRAMFLFDLGDRRIQAVADEGTWVQTVHAFQPRLAHSASRPPASDLTGTSALDMAGLPLSLALIRRAQALIASAEGRGMLGLEGGSYRTTSSGIAGDRTRQHLYHAFWDTEAPYDPGPIAAILAAELQVKALLPHLLELILAPTPILAAAARASAVKLGASLMSAGSLDEVRFFLPDEDLEELRTWMKRKAQS